MLTTFDEDQLVYQAMRAGASGFLLKSAPPARLAEAVPVIAVGEAGRIITAAAVLFAVAIGAFATSKLVFIKELGLGTALAVLIDASIIRALLVPSLMELLGSWNWWSPNRCGDCTTRSGYAKTNQEAPTLHRPRPWPKAGPNRHSFREDLPTPDNTTLLEASDVKHVQSRPETELVSATFAIEAQYSRSDLRAESPMRSKRPAKASTVSRINDLGLIDELHLRGRAGEASRLSP